MKKLFPAFTALMFALGLTVAAQAQTAVEKPKPTPAPAQKVTTQDAGKEAAKADVSKTVDAEAKKVESPATGMKQVAEKGKKDRQTAGSTEKQTGKEVKAAPVMENKPVQETPKTDKK